MSRIAAALLCLILTPAAAAADPLPLTGIGYFVDFEGDFFYFQGDGFIAQSDSVGVFPPKTFAALCTFCALGETVDLSFSTNGEVALGTGSITTAAGTISGVTFTGSFTVTADPLELPEQVQSFLRVTTPFSFTGFLRAQFPSNDGTGEVFANLIGAGSASANFADTVGGAWVHDDEGRINYLFQDVAPVPEPTSLLLVATGLGGAVAARLRARRKPR